MTNVPNRATAEGLPSLTRRLFLRGAAIVAPLATVPALAAMPSYVEENPALLAMEPELDLVEAQMIDANRMYQEALTIGTTLWPRAPDCLLSPTSVYDFSIERDITGAGYGENRRLRTAESARAELSSIMRRRKVTMEIEERRSRIRTQIEAADAYEAACAHANKVSCFPQAEYLRKEMTDVLFACVAKIQAEPAYTMAGIRLKAKALRAWGHAPFWRRVANIHGSDQWAPNLARTLLETLDA